MFANTGVNRAMWRSSWQSPDGAVVGTTFKQDGYIWNDVDADRVRGLMDKVKALRA